MALIAHGELAYWNPISPDILEEWLGRLPLSHDSRVLDVGCGRGQLLVSLCRRFGCCAQGFDIVQESIDYGRTSAHHALEPGLLELHCEAFETGRYEAASFDLAVCLGSSHVLGGYQQTLQALAGLVRPGGLLLVGEGYWKREPDPEYLAFLGAQRGDLSTHSGNLERAVDLSLEAMHWYEASQEEWSLYEDTYAGNVLAYLASNPADPDAEELRKRISAWREAYLRWGQETLGFGLYLFSTPT